MCYANLGTLICQACGRRVGEQPVGTTPCLAGCGKYVSRVTGAVVRGECGVCSEAKEQRSQMTMRLNRAFSKYLTFVDSRAKGDISPSSRYYHQLEVEIQGNYVPLLVNRHLAFEFSLNHHFTFYDSHGFTTFTVAFSESSCSSQLRFYAFQ
ncbi:hypothetical protein FDECE_2345 [Fusarium decemcellulare]|nr:hypothetical protein FDECE_2345 [Fusarium decemcellulare]